MIALRCFGGWPGYGGSYEAAATSSNRNSAIIPAGLEVYAAVGATAALCLYRTLQKPGEQSNSTER